MQPQRFLPKTLSYFLLLVSTNAASITSQTDKIPSCAITCATAVISSIGCGFSDINCICRNDSFVATVVPCLIEQCTSVEIETSLAILGSLCQNVGVVYNTTYTLLFTSGPAIASHASTLKRSTLTGTSSSRVLRPTITDEDFPPSNTTLNASSSLSLPTSQTTSDHTSRAEPDGSNRTESDPSQSAANSNRPIGLIVGGVIGGIASISLLMAFAWLIIREKDKKKYRDELNLNPPTEAMGPGTGQSDEQSPGVHSYDTTEVSRWNTPNSGTGGWI